LDITADDDFNLIVDGVAWAPVSTGSYGSRFVISSGGRFNVVVDGRIVFTFTNNYVSDFTRRGASCLIVDGDGNRTAFSDVLGGRYVQMSYPANSVRGNGTLRGSDISTSDMLAFGFTSSNGDVVASAPEGVDYVSFQISNFDPSQPIMIRCGNVLVCFIYPA